MKVARRVPFWQFIRNIGWLWKHFSFKPFWKWWLLSQNSIQKGKGLDLRAELTYVSICRVFVQAFNVKFNHVFRTYQYFFKNWSRIYWLSYTKVGSNLKQKDSNTRTYSELESRHDLQIYLSLEKDSWVSDKTDNVKESTEEMTSQYYEAVSFEWWIW